MEVNKILQGDCLERLKELPDNSVDSIITDPPYGLSFMGKKWDYDVPSVKVWKECLRVLKPGGHLLSFAGSRTYHRMAVNIEDAGFEIRDQIMWIYGSGFPKSMNVGKAIEGLLTLGSSNVKDIKKLNGVKEEVSCGFNKTGKNTGYRDKEYSMVKTNVEYSTKQGEYHNGFGTALKPAHEPIVVARKPISEKNIALNVLKYGTGGINIDECRIRHNEQLKETNRSGRDNAQVMSSESCGFDNTKNNIASANPKGRFPANIILDEQAGKMLDKQSGKSRSKKQEMGAGWSKNQNVLNESRTGDINFKSERGFNDYGGASRFFYCAKTSKGERNLGLENTNIKEKPIPINEPHNSKNLEERYKMTSKNNHPTVKPIKLMEYLVKLITKEGQIVLDPFLGSGTTAIACINLKRNWIGIEKEPEYIEIAQARINHFSKQKKLGELN